MRGGGEFEEFKEKYNRLNSALDDLPMSKDIPGRIVIKKQLEELCKSPHYAAMVSENIEKDKAATEAKAAAAAKTAADEAAAAQQLPEARKLKPSSSNREQQLKFKNSFLDYKPKAVEKVYTDDEVKTKLLTHQDGPGSSFRLRIPEFQRMTDDEYNDWIGLLDNLGQRGLYDDYKSIVNDLYGQAAGQSLTFNPMNWSAMDRADKSGKTNLLPTIENLDKTLGETNILRKTDKEENIYEGFEP